MYVDARYEKVRLERRIVSVAFLVAIGVRDNGTRELLGFRTGAQESHLLWKEFLDSLVERGLQGVRLPITMQSSTPRDAGRCHAGIRCLH